jgi:hypothetical protein
VRAVHQHADACGTGSRRTHSGASYDGPPRLPTRNASNASRCCRPADSCFGALNGERKTILRRFNRTESAHEGGYYDQLRITPNRFMVILPTDRDTSPSWDHQAHLDLHQ